MTSLEEFAKGKERRRGRASFWTSLPEDVRGQIVASDASTAVVIEWLHDLGFTAATVGNVEPPRRQERRERDRTSEP